MLSFLMVVILLVSACLGLGGLSAFPKVSKVEVSHSHEHSHDDHSHEESESHHEAVPESQAASSQDSHTHTHTIVVVAQAAVVVPQVLSSVLVPKYLEIQFFSGEAQPPVDPFLGSIFRPPIFA